MKKLLTFCALSIILLSALWAQTTIHTNACASATSGWTYTNGGGIAIQQTGYWLVDNTGDAIISEPFNVSTYTGLTLTFKVGTYGSGTNHSCKVEYSTDGGTNWNATTFTSATPTSSTMISAGTWNLGTISTTQLKFRWYLPDGGSKGVRIDDILFQGVIPPPPNPPVATNATSVTNTSFTANWGEVSGATSYRLDVYNKTAGGNASDLFISEYLEGSSNNKCIEIYNGTGTSINLSSYSLRKQANGAGSFGGDYPLTGNLAHGSVHIVANSSANSTILALANQTTGGTPLDFNGNDAVALYKSGVMIDLVGIFDQVSPDWGANLTLVRKAAATVPITIYSASDWVSYPSDTTTYLDSHTFSGGVTTTFITGYQDKNVSNVTTYSVTGLTASNTYYYVVRAVNAYGTSVNSNEVSVTTNATPPTITVSPSTLTDFTYIAGSGPSTPAKTFTVSGATLIAQLEQFLS